MLVEFEKIEELVKIGWIVDMSLGIDVEAMEARIGDSNCPNHREYNPKTGDGYSYVDIDDFLPLQTAIDAVYDACKKKEKVFGEKYD